MRAIAWFALIFVFISAPLTAFAEDASQASITDILIKGNTKVEADTIRSKMSVTVGDVFSPSAVRADVSAVYKMGYFDDVRVEAEGYAGGLRLIFTVVERPIIRSFTYEGNDNLESSKLREKTTLTPYSIFNPSLVDENAQILQYYYQTEGYFKATVVPVINILSNKEVTVVFLINEGGKVRIDDIEFTGNEVMSSGELKGVMTTKEYIFLWSWIMNTGTYKLYDFAMDLESIKALYFNNGYIQASVGEPDVVLDEENDELDITIHIREGEQFNVGTVELTGNTIFESEGLTESMDTKPGEIMSRDVLKRDIEKLTDLYGMVGHAFANITPTIEPDAERRIVDIKLNVEEGDKIYVNRIEITGNSKTKDNVIRRELPFLEGEKYNTAGLKETKERLKNLDYFEDNIEIVPSRIPDKNEVDLKVSVKEKSTGSFSVGGGYSTVDRLMAIGEIKQKNLFGSGQSLSFRAQWGSRRHDFTLSFVEPWLFGKPVSLGIDLFNEEQNQSIGFSQRSTGGSISLGRRFWRYWSLTGSYSYVNYEYFDVSDSMIAVSPPGSYDPQTISKVGMGIARDSRDNYVLPHRGSKNTLFGEFSGPTIGSDRSYYRAMADTVWHFPFYFDSTFSLHGRAGLVYSFGGSNVPPSELFYVGGINTVRGYDWGTIGPKPKVALRDKITNNLIKFVEGQVIGGNKELIFNAEYTFPLISEINLLGVAFFDAGNAYGHGEALDVSSLRYSAGGGFRWLSPMGLIRLEYGKILDSIELEQKGKWEFSIGTMF